MITKRLRFLLPCVAILAAVLLIVSTTLSQLAAQPRPHPVERPPWKDVCCGGPCCAKPRPAR
ncbi:hypothetical protein EYW49_18150 [Siculibacillus lacustris]|uniref:Secreted protein n=1 Tax=Siculibacillus lacustris TaxID=1549641 RepID=A0A4Q9VJD3_9HYPH|nr:hypothetical protein [Siculibacillus lacustris]TBW34509.1 hypothetical protein EYW49_18150 [Siculibacillus lacustris]